MTRDELAWLLIRLAGIVFLAIALGGLISTVPSLVTFIADDDISRFGHTVEKEIIDHYKEAKLKSVISVIVPLFSYVFVYAALGFYLLFRGNLIFRLVTKVGSSHSE